MDVSAFVYPPKVLGRSFINMFEMTLHHTVHVPVYITVEEIRCV